MSRLLFWVILIIVIGFAVRAKLRAAIRKSQLQQEEQWRWQQNQQQGRQAEPVSIENMTSCAHCGLHFPASEAVRADGLDYCSPAHVRLPPR